MPVLPAEGEDREAEGGPGVVSKYRNVKINGFDSKAEYARWQELKILERAGQITDLKRQMPFDLAIGPMLICRYKSDFCYFDVKRAEWVVEDVKGVKTATYSIKRKLMLALHGVRIKEINAKDLRVRRAK